MSDDRDRDYWLSRREFDRWEGDHEEHHRLEEERIGRVQRAFEDFRDRADARQGSITLMLLGTTLAAILSGGISLVLYLITRHSP